MGIRAVTVADSLFTPIVVTRDSLAPGTYLPGATTTGTLGGAGAYSTADTYEGNRTYSGTNAETISHKRFRGYVYLTGSSKTFIDCLFEGVTAPTNAAVNCNYDTSASNLFKDCTFAPRGGTDTTDTIIGRGYTLLRCDLSKGVDGLGAARATTTTRTDVVVESSWIHDLLYFSPSTTHPDNETHSDCIQWHGGLGLTIRNSRLEGFSSSPDANRAATYDGATKTGGHRFYPNPVVTSVLMINGVAAAPTGELVMEGNWIDGGYVGVNALQDAYALSAGAFTSRIVGNHVGANFGYGPTYFVTTLAAKTLTLTGNYLWDNANPLTATTPANYRVNS